MAQLHDRYDDDDDKHSSTANYKGVGNNNNFGRITGIHEKLDKTCKQNALKYITQGNETLLSDWQKESG